MLKLVIYKKKACIYLVGGTKEAIITLDKLNTLIIIIFGMIIRVFTIKENFIVSLIDGKQQI